MRPFLLAALLTVVCFAKTADAAGIASATVKIVSSTLDLGVQLKGSGLAFAVGAETYVVTSDHVILHQKSKSTNQISFASGEIATAEYVASDFGRGLGLLRILSGNIKPGLPTLSKLAGVDARLGDKAVMLGYPAMSDGLVKDRTGKISNTNLISNVFVQVLELIEVSEGHAEFGMSGGVLSNSADDFVGILSHQVYSENGGTIKNTILVIPSALVMDWLKQYFAESGPYRSFITLVQSDDQVSGQLSRFGFSTANLYFTYTTPFGDGRSYFLIVHSGLKSSSLYASESGDLQKYTDFLAVTECNLYVIGFRKRNQVGSLSATSLLSADRGTTVSIIRRFADVSLEPVTRLWCEGQDEAILKLRDHYQTLNSSISSAPNQSLNLFFVLRGYIENYLRYQDTSYKNNTYYALKPSDLERLKNDAIYQSDWAELEKWGHAQQLRDQIDDLIQTFSILTI